MKKQILTILIIFVIISGCIFLYFVNPEETPLIPCMFHQLTGLDCPGCGITRAIHFLMHLNFLAAIQYNALFVFTLILGVIYVIIKMRNHSFKIKTNWLYSYLGIMVIFTVIRNLV